MVIKSKYVTINHGDIIGTLKRARMINYDDIEILWYKEDGDKKIIQKMILHYHSWRFETLNGVIFISTEANKQTDKTPNASTTFLLKK
ncbi:MAG: hypothetical protein WC025_02020 [Candidatus Magasanikbacteria bacterium]